MDVYQLEVFTAVYVNRSFSRASEELNITQPSVSIHIKKLEEELGVSLFDRVGKKTIPTKEGEFLFQRAEEIIQKINNIRTDLIGSEDTVAGLLRIGASSIPGSYIIPQAVAGFKKIYPDISFRINIDNSREITEKIISGELLCAIVDEINNKDNIACLHEIEDELILVAAPGFTGKKVITPFKLLTMPILVRDEGSDATRSMEKQHLINRISIKALNVVATLGSTESIKEAVKSGLGAAILSRFVVKDDLKAGLVEEIRIRGVRMKRKFYVISHKNRSLPVRYTVFLDFLIKA
ncbi:MAG: LysR family transcriptional regulator [Thermodesulfovibrionia bacterium]|nr:LysR family transcriptional regulator [Thermodesulfovibrionia bacterium]